MVKFFNVEKTLGCCAPQDFSNAIIPSLWNTNGCIRVPFREAAIVTLFKQTKIHQKSWGQWHDFLFLVKGSAVWKKTRNQFKPVWAESLKITLHRNWNCSTPKTGTDVVKVAYERWRAFLSLKKKGPFWRGFLLKH